MTLDMIHLRCFRNHRDTAIAFQHRNGILIGENGQGKTNILEAISYTCLTKSFYAVNDSTVTTIGEPGFTVEGSFRLDDGRDAVAEVRYDAMTNHKTVSVNGIQLDRAVELVGQFPIVILSPEHGAITFSGPVERRRFVDITLSQSGSLYLQDLLEYRKVLRQRNSLLLDCKKGGSVDESLMAVWNESLIQYAGRIVLKRKQFLKKFIPGVRKEYAQLTQTGEEPDIAYETSGEGETLEEISLSLRKALDAKHREEIKMGTTLAGPHRDDFVFSISGLDVRRYASQGQHKTFLIALKLAEFSYLKDLKNETPLVLLDDVFSELDLERSNRLLTHLELLGQTFITTTEENLARKWASTGAKFASVRISRGTGRIENETIAA